MKVYLAAEGGGSKLLMLLYNEAGEILSSGRMTGPNTHRPVADVIADMENLLTQVVPPEITEIQRVDLNVLKHEKNLLSLLQKNYSIHEFYSQNEGAVALASAGYLEGIVAQCGTGSDAFFIQNAGRDVIGGWGFILGDEGSGFDIGRHALKAAIYASDGRGPKTVILDILMKEWKLSKLSDLVNIMFDAPDYRPVMASASKIASQAAQQGDSVALRIYEYAAHEMALHVFAAISRNGNHWNGPIVASGGAWKGSEHMFDCFCQEIGAVYPDAKVLKPIFEPVIGCIAMRFLQEGMSFETFQATFKSKFQDYLL